MIFVTIVTLGFAEGVGIGIAITTVFFAARLGRVDAIEATFTARERHSNKSRPIADRAILLSEGERVRAYRLRGYIFFGSAHSLVERLRQSLGDEPPPACILLDFGAVSGLDFSAVNTLCGFIRGCARGRRAGGSERGARELPGGDWNAIFPLPSPPACGSNRTGTAPWSIARISSSSPGGRTSAGRAAPATPLLERFSGEMESHLDRRILFEDLAHELREWLEVRDYEPGEGPGRNGHGAGRSATAADGPGLGIRHRGNAPCASAARAMRFEPRGAFGAHAATANTIADEPCRTLMLVPAVRRRLEETQGPLMLKLYGYLLTAGAPAESLPGPEDRLGRAHTNAPHRRGTRGAALCSNSVSFLARWCEHALADKDPNPGCPPWLASTGDEAERELASNRAARWGLAMSRGAHPSSANRYAGAKARIRQYVPAHAGGQEPEPWRARPPKPLGSTYRRHTMSAGC